MSTPKKGTWIDLGDEATGGGHSIPLFWDEKEPDRIHMIVDDPRLVDGEGKRPGLRLVFSSNPRSADYSPANYNRCARLLRAKGCPAPAEDAPEHRRHLKERDGVIAAVFGTAQEQEQGAPPAPPAATAALPEDAVVCPKCLCFVADVEQHDSLAH